MKLGVALRRSLRLLAGYGVVAIGVFCVLPVFYLSAIRPAQQQLEALQRDVALLRTGGGRSSAGADKADPAQELADLYRALPAVDAAPQWLEKVFTAAQAQGLNLDRGEYRATPERIGRLIRLHITLPVSGEYTSIRRFLRVLSADIPAMSLEHVQFERQQVGEPTVDAKITLVLYLVHES